MDDVDKITEIRRQNNDCWMDLLRLAIKHAPEETREILLKITKNDREITWLMAKL